MIYGIPINQIYPIITDFTGIIELWNTRNPIFMRFIRFP